MDRSKPYYPRLGAALAHQKADRIPNFDVFIGARSASHILGRETADNSWSMAPETAAELCRKIGQDAMVCSLGPGIPEGSVQSAEDLWNLTLPEPDSWKAKIDGYCAVAAEGRRRGTGDVGVCARIGGPLTQTYMACGPIPIQSFMLYLYDKPDLIAAMMERFVDYSLSIIAAIKKSDFQFYYIGDDLSSTTGPLISPDMIAQVWAPQYERIIRAAQETGKPIVNHCCGDQSPVLPYLLDWGVEATHPLQPGANDIYAVREQYGNRITLIGNMDIAKALSFGTEEEVAEETMEHIQRLGKDGSYVVCSSHSIIDSVIPENFLAMVRTAMEYRW